MKVKKEWIGWWDGLVIYDPLHNAPCLVCHTDWSEADSICIAHLLSKSYTMVFYRTHRTCYGEQTLREGSELLTEVIKVFKGE